MQRWLWPLFLLLALAFIGWRQHQSNVFETDMLRLLPSWSADPVVQAARARVREQAQSQALFLVSATRFENAQQQAQVFATQLRTSSLFERVEVNIDAPDLEALAKFYTPYADRLLHDKESQALALRPAEEKQTLLQHWFNPVGISLENDPFGNVARFLQHSTSISSNLNWRDGVLVAHADDRYWVLVRAQTPDKVFERDWQNAALSAITTAQQSLHDADVVWTGLFKFAQASRERTTNELNWISSVGTVGLLLIMWLVLRRLRPVLLMLAVITTSMIGATALSLLVYEQLHLITYVFGATLIGIAGDYALHYLVLHASSGAQWHAQSAIKQLAKPLTIALLTTLLAYAAICITPFDGFRQMAVFCLFGLLCAYLSVVLFLPFWLHQAAAKPARFSPSFARLHQRIARRPNTATLIVSGLLMVVVIGYGLIHLRADDDIHLLQKPDDTLIREQQQLSAITGLQPATQFVLVRGENAEQVLQREEAAVTQLQKIQNSGSLSHFRALTSWLPSQQRQQNNQALLLHHAEHGVIAEAVREIGNDPVKLPSSKPLLPEQFWSQTFAAPLQVQWLQKEQEFASMITLDGVRDREALSVLNQLPGVQVIDERAAISNLFAQFRQQAFVWVVLAYVLVALLLSWQRGVVAMAQRLLPTIVATTLTVALLGVMGIAINLFHGVALMLVLGIGVDYALFLADGEGHEPSSLLAIVLSAITAIMAFGLLSFSHLPAVSGFGLTVGVGVALALLLAPTVFWWPKRE